jgi:hypothetical protein
MQSPPTGRRLLDAGEAIAVNDWQAVAAADQGEARA